MKSQQIRGSLPVLPENKEVTDKTEELDRLWDKQSQTSYIHLSLC